MSDDTVSVRQEYAGVQTFEIGVPMLDAMRSLKESVVNCDLDDDCKAIFAIWYASVKISEAFLEALAPPPSEGDCDTGSDMLAHNLWRELDATQACIETFANEADRRWREKVDLSLVSDED